MSDQLHPSDRCWIDYHVRMGMAREQATLALRTYRSMIQQIMGREPEADISDVLLSAETKLVEARRSTPAPAAAVTDPTPVEWLTTVRNGQNWTQWQLERFDAAIDALSKRKQP